MLLLESLMACSLWRVTREKSKAGFNLSPSMHLQVSSAPTLFCGGVHALEAAKPVWSSKAAGLLRYTLAAHNSWYKHGSLVRLCGLFVWLACDPQSLVHVSSAASLIEVTDLRVSCISILSLRSQPTKHAYDTRMVARSSQHP